MLVTLPIPPEVRDAVCRSVRESSIAVALDVLRATLWAEQERAHHWLPQVCEGLIYPDVMAAFYDSRPINLCLNWYDREADALRLEYPERLGDDPFRGDANVIPGLCLLAEGFPCYVLSEKGRYALQRHQHHVYYAKPKPAPNYAIPVRDWDRAYFEVEHIDIEALSIGAQVASHDFIPLSRGHYREIGDLLRARIDSGGAQTTT